MGYLVARAVGVDVRRRGSGNIGATNVLRTAGPAAAVATLLGDVAKGYLGTWVGGRLGAPEPAWAAAAAVLTVAGNCWSLFLGGQGGKGVATGLGAFLRLAPAAVAPAAGTWALLVAAFRFVSLGSLGAAAVLPVALALWGYDGWRVAAAVAVGVIVVLRHRANVARLLAGTERRLGEREGARVRGGADP